MNSININTICKIASGFSAQVIDHIEHSLDLNQYLITHPAATFFVRAEGDSMRDVGILNDDLLVVDRSLIPQNNSIVIAIINGEFFVKRLKIVDGKGFLYTANKYSQPIAVADVDGLQFWGVVTHAIHAL
ncbi:MAG TPA: translesion error-prone DNA polymerase V autoproteolytic subunit [Gammaproteobacteria bacterium]|nr:translesion error-prone DNA polymerase V autoproteolytic subunit [Gammaproteobacteria bacterium]